MNATYAMDASNPWRMWYKQQSEVQEKQLREGSMEYL